MGEAMSVTRVPRGKTVVGKPRAAAVYARISDDTEGRAAGVTRQVEDSLKLAERDGWELAPLDPFVDNDISASTKSRKRRPDFERLVRLINEGAIDGVLFYSNSRLTRRPREFEDIIELVERTGVQLNSVVSGKADLSTADGRHIARILASTDAAEAERTAERVTRAFVQRRAEGKPNPSSRAFGFEAGGVEIRESEAELIREAANRIIDEGWSLGMVVRDWNERNIPTVRNAGGWSRITVSRTLTNPRVAGYISHRGELLGRGSFEAILTRDQQEQMKSIFTDRRRGNVTTFTERKHVLAGFLVCGRCGGPMKVNGLLDADGGYRQDSFVICSATQYGCGRVKRNLRQLQQYLDGAVRGHIEAATPVGDGGVPEAMGEQAEKLQAQLDEVTADIADLQAAFKAHDIRFKDYNAALSALRDLEEETARELRILETDVQVDPDLDLLAAWEDGTVPRRRAVLGQVIDHVKLHPIGKVGPVRARQMIPESTEVVWR